jgi:hypothetical protein
MGFESPSLHAVRRDSFDSTGTDYGFRALPRQGLIGRLSPTVVRIPFNCQSPVGLFAEECDNLISHDL